MKRVLVVIPSIDPPGGGEGLAAWMLQGLRSDHQVGLQIWRPPDLARTNRYFGTTLTPGDFRLHLASSRVRSAFARLPLPLALLRDAWLMREARRRAADYDVVVGFFNEADLGERAVQYVHYPRFHPDRQRRGTWYQRSSPLVALYRAVVLGATGYSTVRMRRTPTLANSDWVAEKLRVLHQIEVRTVYPPVWAAPAAPRPWNERADGFLCIGRISPEKRVERAVDIVERVRHLGHDARLHIVGTVCDPAYLSFLEARLAPHASWATLHHDLSRHQVTALIAANRYGLHAMENEHFGMAVAEMIKGGCLVFVPNSGGQVEIVAGDRRFLYDSVADAAAKIAATLADPARQTAMREHASRCAERFSVERFTLEMREAIAAP